MKLKWLVCIVAICGVMAAGIGCGSGEEPEGEVIKTNPKDNTNPDVSEGASGGASTNVGVTNN